MAGKRRGEVTSVKDLFSKYKLLLTPPQKTVEMEVIRVVGECVGLRLAEGQVAYTVSTRTVNLQVSGMIKQEVKIKQQEILAELKRRLGEKNAPVHIL
jgi:hypothetical protein